MCRAHSSAESAAFSTHDMARRCQALSSILEILHAAYLDEQSEASDPLLADHLVEGLFVAARALCDVDAAHDAGSFR